MRPASLPTYVSRILHYTNAEKSALATTAYKSLLKGKPLVSVVIPAYNEELNVLNSVLSISQNVTDYSVEIIVVNNNSTDRTQEVASATGVTCILETKKGVTNARTTGLIAAQGKYIINADADSIYPVGWINEMITPLEHDEKVALAYSRFAFIPGESTSRFSYFLYENMADSMRFVHRNFKEEAVNVYGCSSAFRKDQCLQVDAYDHPPGTGEDGWLALKLRNKGFGKLHYVPTMKALVWTVDRHIQEDGGLWKALFMRVKGAIFGHDPAKYHVKG